MICFCWHCTAIKGCAAHDMLDETQARLLRAEELLERACLAYEAEYEHSELDVTEVKAWLSDYEAFRVKEGEKLAAPSVKVKPK